MLLFLSYWCTVYGSTDFLIYTGPDQKILYHLIATVPVCCMLIEFPFNMIPIDWPMLAFVELQFLIYLFINFLVVTCEADH